MSINRYTCTGNLTKDPELRELPSGEKVCELRLAVDGMGGMEEPGFITVSVFGRGGEAAAQYLSRGWLVAIDGRLQFGEWESEERKRHEYTVVGNVEFLAPPRSEQESPRRPSSRRDPVTA
jgi:single-strand DNA-binding protein